MKYAIYIRRDDVLIRVGLTSLRHDQFLPLLPDLARRYREDLHIEDQHRRLVASVSAEGDVSTMPALYQPTR